MAEHLWGDLTGSDWYPTFPASLEEDREDHGILIYPNPSKGKITIEKPTNSTSSNISLKNILGEIVMVSNSNKNIITFLIWASHIEYHGVVCKMLNRYSSSTI